MRAFVRFRLPDGRTVDLGHGDLIGRLGSARLCLDDPSISEAHAMVSLRGRDLWLLGLRGRFSVDATNVISKLRLSAGQRVRLSRETTITVEDLELPREVLAIEGDGLPRQVLAGVCSLRHDSGRLRLTPRLEPEADAWFYFMDDAWRMRASDGASVPIGAGDTWQIGTATARAVLVCLDVAAETTTRRDGAVVVPLHLVVQYTAVHIHRESEPAALLTGIGARIIGELVGTGVPTPWPVLAREIWPDDADPTDLRARFDTALTRLRRRLRELEIRDDLVSTDGHGSVQLVLHAHDTVKDEG